MSSILHILSNNQNPKIKVLKLIEKQKKKNTNNNKVMVTKISFKLKNLEKNL